MSKFCPNCGSQQPDGANVCGNCGNAFPTQESIIPNAPIAKSKKPIIIAVAAIAAIALVIVAIVLIVPNFGYKSAIKNQIAVTFKGKSEKLKSLAPKEYWDALEDAGEQMGSDLSFGEIRDSFEDSWDDTKDELEDEYGKNFKVTFKITDKDEYTGKKFTNLKNELKNTFDIKKKDIGKAYKLDIEFRIKGSEDDDDWELDDVIAIQIDGDWYLCTENGGFYLGVSDTSEDSSNVGGAYDDYDDYDDYDEDYDYYDEEDYDDYY